jgi:hypothetical protein
MGIPKHRIALIKNLYVNQEATRQTEYGNTDWFNIDKEVRQGCILSSYLFNVYDEQIMKHADLKEATAGVKIGERNINNLRYADDTTLMAESAEDLKYLLTKLMTESLTAGLKLNMNKTVVMTTGPLKEFKVDDEQIEIVEDLIFLGSRINIDGNCSREINRRLMLGRQAMFNLDKLMKSRDINLNTTKRIVQAMVFPITIYSCESWIMKKHDRRKVDVFES